MLGPKCIWIGFQYCFTKQGFALERLEPSEPLEPLEPSEPWVARPSHPSCLPADKTLSAILSTTVSAVTLCFGRGREMETESRSGRPP